MASLLHIADSRFCVSCRLYALLLHIPGKICIFSALTVQVRLYIFCTLPVHLFLCIQSILYPLIFLRHAPHLLPLISANSFLLASCSSRNTR